MKSMKRWMGYAWLLVVLWAGVWAPDAGAQDARNTMAAKTLMTRSSPFDPPMEDAFTADAGAGLDTGCTFNDDPEHPLVISVLVDRYVGEVDGSGFLVNPGDLVSQGIIPATVDVIMPAFDVDVNGSPPPEQDAVLFNGEQLGLLNGGNQIWLLNSFTVDISKVKFPASPGGGPAVNQVQINVDILSSGRWCTAIDWVSLVIPIRPKIALTLTARGGNKVREITDDIIYKQSFDADCNLTTDIGPLEEFPFAGSISKEVVLHTEIEFCPASDTSPEVKAEWTVSSSPMQRGTDTWTGTEGDVTLKMPSQVGAYTAMVEYEIDRQMVPATRRLYVTYNTPRRTSDCTSPTCAPKRDWYKLATDWASGATDEATAIRGVRVGMYGNPLGWTYLDNYTPGRWVGLIESTIGDGNCVVFSDILKNMSAVLGADAGSEDRVVISPGFITRARPSIDRSFAMAGPHPTGARDRYVFGMHSLVNKGSIWYDATYNGEYGSRTEFIDWRISDPVSTEIRDGFIWYKTDEGALIRNTGMPLPAPYGASWGNEFRYLPPPAAAPKIVDASGQIPHGALMTTAATRFATQGTNAQFTGNVSYALLDADTDGIAEALRADVEVEILQTGTYTVSGALMQGGTTISTRPTFTSMSPNLSKSVSGGPGVYTVAFQFSGEEIFQAGLDGSYDLDLHLLGAATLEDQLVHSTPTYTHTQFGELPMALAAVAEQGQDLDSDGKFDVLRAEVTVLVRTAGDFLLDGTLWKDGTTLLTTNAPVEQSLGPGTHVLTLDFDGGSLQQAGLDGPYTLHLSVMETNTLEVVEGIFETQAFDADDFEMALLEPDGSFDDQGLDTNSNGLFDLLRINFGANIRDAGTYLVSGTLRNSSGPLVVFTDAEMTLPAGTQTLTLDFHGPLIREQGLDGPYEVDVVLRAPTTFEERARVALPQQTATYAHTDFDPFEVADILLTGTSNDMGVDIDSNGLFDELHVDVEVALTTTDFYQWSARLVDANGTELDFDARSGSRSAGTSTINFVFDGEAIGANGVDGPYFVRGLLMFGNTGPNIVATDVAETSAYSYQDFEGSVLPVTLTVASEEPDTGVDIAVSPLDLNGEGNGVTAFERTYALGTEVTLTAADTAPDGNVFLDWQVDGTTVSTAPTLLVTMDEEQTVVARYTVPLPHPFVLLADEKLDIDSVIEADGDIHSNDTIDIKKGNPSTYVGTITAVGVIKIDQDNTIDGDVMAGGIVDLDDGATVTGTVTEQVPLATIPVPTLTFSAGGNQVTVDQDGTLALSPGSYGDVKVEAGGTLLLAHDGAGGDYFFEKLDLKKEAILSVEVTQGPVAVNVVQDINLDKDTQLAVTATNHHGSRYLTVRSLVGNIDVKKNARLQGSFIAPEGTVSLDKEVLFQGGICAKDIEVKKDALLYNHVSAQALPAAPERAAPKSSDGPGAAEDGIPTMVSLKPNYPNPFNPVTTIAFELSEAQQVTLDVYDVVGRHVATLVDGRLPHGVHEVTWDAHGMPTGVYYYRLQGQASTQVRQMVLLK